MIVVKRGRTIRGISWMGSMKTISMLYIYFFYFIKISVDTAAIHFPQHLTKCIYTFCLYHFIRHIGLSFSLPWQKANKTVHSIILLAAMTEVIKCACGIAFTSSSFFITFFGKIQKNRAGLETEDKFDVDYIIMLQ